FRLSGWKSLFSASIERTTENPIFEARLGEGSWQLEKPLNKDGTRRIQLRYRFRRTVLSNLIIPGLVLPEDQRLRLSTLSSTWIRDTRDKPLDAHQGFYQTLDFGRNPGGHPEVCHAGFLPDAGFWYYPQVPRFEYKFRPFHGPG